MSLQWQYIVFSSAFVAVLLTAVCNSQWGGMNRRWYWKAAAKVTYHSDGIPIGLYVDSNDRFIIASATYSYHASTLAKGRFVMRGDEVTHADWEEKDYKTGRPVEFWRHVDMESAEHKMPAIVSSCLDIIHELLDQLGVESARHITLVGDAPWTAHREDSIRLTMTRYICMTRAVTLALDLPHNTGSMSTWVMVMPSQTIYTCSSSHETCACKAHVIPEESSLNLQNLLENGDPAIESIIVIGDTPQQIQTTPKSPPLNHHTPEIFAHGAAIHSGKVAYPDLGPFNTYVHLGYPWSIAVGGGDNWLTHTVTAFYQKTGQTILSTVQDDQTDVQVMVFVGDRPSPSDNSYVTTMVLKGLPPRPKGETKCLFSLSASWKSEMVLMTLQLVDLGTGQRVVQSFPSHSLPDLPTNPHFKVNRMTMQELDQSIVENRESDTALRKELEDNLERRDLVFANSVPYVYVAN